MLKFDNIDEGLVRLARSVRKAGYKKQANKIVRLSSKSEQVVDILIDSFKNDLGPDLALERANNLSLAVLYYEPREDDIETYIHDGLMKTNESFYRDVRKRTLSDQKAWSLAEKAIKQLQHKKLLPQDLN